MQTQKIIVWLKYTIVVLACTTSIVNLMYLLSIIDISLGNVLPEGLLPLEHTYSVAE